MTAADVLARLAPDARAAALAALDEISAPLHDFEIERLLRDHLSRSQRRVVVKALQGLAIIAIEPA